MIHFLLKRSLKTMLKLVKRQKYKADTVELCINFLTPSNFVVKFYAVMKVEHKYIINLSFYELLLLYLQNWNASKYHTIHLCLPFLLHKNQLQRRHKTEDCGQIRAIDEFFFKRKPWLLDTPKGCALFSSS
jgi:hypothetical protein